MTTTQTKPKVAVVVVATDEVFPLDQCLNQFRDMVEAPEDVVFVDNGSNGKMKAFAERECPGITVVVREENGHFCGGYNTGLQWAMDNGYDFALFVNADTSVDNPNFINDLVAAADRHPKGAFFGPTVYFREAGEIQNTILSFPFFRRQIVDWFRFRFAHPNRSAKLVERRVEYLNGVCVLARLDALREAGLFDETLAIYIEDVDLHWRTNRLGWYSVYVPTPSIIHHQKATGYDHFSLNSFMLRRNTVYWHVKCGHMIEARLYAASANVLSWFRSFGAKNPGYVTHYLRRSREVFRKLIARESIGSWFGPMQGPWQHES